MADENRVDIEFGARTGELDGAFSKLENEAQDVGGTIQDSFTRAKYGVDALSVSVGKMASQYSGLSTVVDRNSLEMKQSSESVDALLNRYDPLGAKLRQLKEDFRQLDLAASSGKISSRDDIRLDQAYARLQREISATSAATNSYSAANGKATLSAGQLRNATHQLPMQFTDIWVSLAAGQSPMMVLIQQGSQIKDSFGGVGMAARAMGGYIMGLINPITLAAAAVAAGAYAWVQWGDAAEKAVEKARKASKDAVEDAKRATAGIQKTPDEQIKAIEYQIQGVRGQLDAAMKRRDAITRKTSAEEAQAIGAELGARREQLASLERQIEEIKKRESERQTKKEPKISYKTETGPEMAEAAAALALQKEHAKASEAETRDQYARGLITTKEYYDKKLALAETSLLESIAVKRKELELLAGITPKNKSDELKIKRDEVSITGQINVLEAQRAELIKQNTREYNKEEQQRSAAMEKLLAQQQLDSAQAGVARDAADNQQKLAMRQITAAQLFEMQKQEEQRSLEATKEFLRAKLEAEFENSGNKMQTMQEYAAAVEAAERKHQQKLTDIDNKAALERAKYSLQAQEAVQGSMSTMFEDLMKGTKSLSDAFKDFAASVIADIIRIQAQRMAAEIMGASSGKDGGSSSTIGSIIGKWLGGSFAVGTNYVPNDMLAMVHKGERIVPASQNNPAMLGGGGSSMTVHNNFTVAGSVDTRTQAQIATLAGLSLQRAMARNA